MKNLAIIKIAGKGTRIHSDIPKQFIEVQGKPIFIYTLEAFEKAELVDAISIVTSEAWMDFVKENCIKYNITKAKFFCLGDPKYGNGSTYNGYQEALNNYYKPEFVISHDGVRALITPEDIDACIKVCIDSDNGICQWSKELVGSVVYKKDHWKCINRTDIVEFGTPIVIRNVIFKKLYEFFKNATDEQKESWFGLDTEYYDLGHSSKPYISDKLNFKITTDNDLQFFKDLIEIRSKK